MSSITGRNTQTYVTDLQFAKVARSRPRLDRLLEYGSGFRRTDRAGLTSSRRGHCHRLALEGTASNAFALRRSMKRSCLSHWHDPTSKPVPIHFRESGSTSHWGTFARIPGVPPPPPHTAARNKTAANPAGLQPYRIPNRPRTQPSTRLPPRIPVESPRGELAGAQCFRPSPRFFSVRIARFRSPAGSDAGRRPALPAPTGVRPGSRRGSTSWR